MTLLVARGLTKRFGGVVANQSVDFDIEQREIHAVIGPNGAGKSTFMSQLSGELLPDEGSITLDGRDVTNLPIHRRAQLGLCRCYQVSRVFLDRSAIENIAIGVLARQGGHLRAWRDTRGDKALYDPARQILADVGLSGREDVQASALSHGERRQLELAMALATKPSLLLLDEPMAGMGPAESRTIVDLIATLAATTAIVLIEHDMEAVMALAKRISVLVDGQVIASGTPHVVVANAAVQEAYLATDHALDDHA
jgi:branched-chain amino acid transport system ATP-binding protein